MSGFYDYFKSLGMPYIRKPGGVNDGLVRTSAGLLDDAKDDIKWLRYQFLPQLCEDKLVGSHAAARGIERYRFESDAYFRNRVANAYQFFANGGTKAGVDAFLAAIGLDAHTVEAHEYTGDPSLGWAEFAAVVNMESLDQTVENRQFLATLLDELKPARSKLALVIFTLRVQFTVPAPVITLGIADFSAYIDEHAFAVRSYETLNGSRLLDGTWDLSNGWGDLTITDL